MSSRRIDQDHTRFRNIVKGRIKRDLKRFVSSGEMIGKQGKRFVSIPLPQINLPRFRFGDNQGNGVGQGEGDEGQAARLIAVMAANNKAASRKRRLRNVNGSACGLAYFATIHPVDQSRTNRAGARRSRDMNGNPGWGSGAMAGSRRTANDQR